MKALKGDRRARGALLGVLFAAGAAAMLAGTQAATAQEASGKSFSRIDTRSLAPRDGKGAGFKPGLLARDGKVKVILELRGDSVGQQMADARRQSRNLTRAQRDAARSELRNRQEPAVTELRKLDAEILARYQDAYNGIAVRVAQKDLATLSTLPNVVSVHPVKVIKPHNTVSARFVEADDAWTDLGLTGAGVKIGILDTGIDYTHATFGGPGTEAAFQAADDNDTTLADGGFPTAKVVGGFDFVGDDYNASATDEQIAVDPNVIVPQPDPDPLDCDGHGSHVAGTAAGFGVLDGETYGGPYTSAALAVFPTGLPFPRNTVGPGIAPEALIYAYRVFGCAGSSSEEVIVAALNRALLDGVDVVNMSLGSVFGRTDEPSAIASNTLAEAGIVVVASSGNEGSSAYITGSPGIANRAISVAAIDSSAEFFPGATLALSTGTSLQVINANGATFADGTVLPVKVLRNADGTVSLGCDPAEYVDVAGKLVVTLRGTCARVARAIYGEKAGAAAVAMINTAATLPPYEGEITENPDTGEPFLVTIPFFGVRGVLGPSPFEDADNLVAADGGTVTLTNARVTNPGFRVPATFTSGGPRNVDSGPKPDVTAPGVSVISTDVGSGFKAAAISGTSMASPVTAGVAALVTEAHPGWSTERIKAAIMNTADTGKFASGYDPRLTGSGVVNARKAVDTVALALAGQGQSALTYGYEPLGSGYSETLPLRLENTGATALTYNLSSSFVGNSRGATMTFTPASVEVPAGGSATVQVTIALSAAAVAGLPAAAVSNFGALVNVRGAVVATPTTGGAGVYSLRVPFMLVPRGLSNVTAALTDFVKQGGSVHTGSLNVANSGIHSGDADVYAWGISDANDVTGAEDSMDVRAAGVQVLPREALCGDDPVGVCGTAGDRSLVFAVNVYGRWSNPSTNEFDIAIDLENDGSAEFFVVGVDIGAVLAGTFDGRFASIIFNAEGEIVNAWVATAPMNGSTLLLPTLASDIGLAEGDPGVERFDYAVAAFSIVPEDLVDVTAFADFRLDSPPVSTGQFATLPPGGSASLPVAFDQGSLAGSKTLGWMVVTLDDANGAPQAELVPIEFPGWRGRR